MVWVEVPQPASSFQIPLARVCRLELFLMIRGWISLPSLGARGIGSLWTVVIEFNFGHIS